MTVFFFNCFYFVTCLTGLAACLCLIAFYSFSVRHWLAATITRWWWPSVTFPVFQIHKNCCVKLLEYFFQEPPIQTFIADFGSPSLPDFWLVLFLCLVDFPPFCSVMLLRVYHFQTFSLNFNISSLFGINWLVLAQWVCWKFWMYIIT